jgi:anti-sigma factor RsiW
MMHLVVLENLEEYLSGVLEPAVRKKIEAHLDTCRHCRQELRGFEDVSLLFGSLRSENALDASPGFYARVMTEVSVQAARPSFANLFSLDLAFGRRLVFASLLTLAVLGSYLVSRETAYPKAHFPEAIMALDDSPAMESVPAPDNMLVTLTAYGY